jgi:hypothetical protein
MTIRLSEIPNFQIAEALPNDVQPDKFHLFDATTEKRLA